MRDRKYIILANEETGREYAVQFDGDLSHKAVADGIAQAMRRNEWGPRMFLDVVAAGFVGNPDKGSDSLGIGPRPQDGSLLGIATVAAPVFIQREPPRRPKSSLLERAKGAKSR